MARHKTRVTIGMPVFNGERHLRQALESILDQTYQDFELIISDNASTDRTQQICFEYEKKDDRITYHRIERNLGAAWNFNHVFKLSSSPYFKWAAHDDVVAPEFLSKCVNLLEQDETVVLCHSKTGRINDFGKVEGEYDCGKVTNSPKPQKRLSDVLIRKGFPWSIFGVFRSDALRRTHLIENYIGADWNFLAEINLVGKTAEIPEYLFFRRQHPESFTDKFYPCLVHNYQKEMLWWTGTKRMSLVTILPRWRSILGFFLSSHRIPRKQSERWSCYEEITRWIVGEGWEFMMWDLASELKFWRINLNR
jgi:glycosyltransferase involved in cell wall biosynthesis